MTLTLQDLFVSNDVSTPAPRAAAAHAHAPSDSFAAFFSHPDDREAAPDNATHDSSATASSPLSTAPSPKDHHTHRVDNARDSDGSDSAPRPHHKSRPDSAAPTPADNARAADQSKASRDATAADNANSNTAATASDAPAAPINLFQVALLAAQADAGNAADQSAPATPQVSAAPAIGSVATDTTPATDAAASVVPMPTADMTALLAGQDDATAQPAPIALPVDLNAQENLPASPTPTAPAAPTAGDIAILSMAAPAAEQAANTAAQAPRPTTTPVPAQTANSLSSRTSGTGRPQSDDIGKTDASSSMSAPSDSATLPTDPLVVPFVPTSVDMAPSADDTAAQNNDPSVGAVGSTAVPTGIATAQQAQTLYTKTASRTDALPQVTVDQVAMHLTKAVDDGIDHLTIHLKPAELGSIEVKLEMGDTGISKATITADRQDTLNLLQRDSHRLEQALDNAGLKTDPGSLSFNLRGDGGRYSPNFSQGNGSPYSPFAGSAADDATSSVNPALLGYINSRAALGGVDIRV